MSPYPFRTCMHIHMLSTGGRLTATLSLVSNGLFSLIHWCQNPTLFAIIYKSLLILKIYEIVSAKRDLTHVSSRFQIVDNIEV